MKPNAFSKALGLLGFAVFVYTNGALENGHLDINTGTQRTLNPTYIYMDIFIFTLTLLLTNMLIAESHLNNNATF